MSERRSIFVPVRGHELHVSEWGDPSAPALVMWHGLARTGRDFDAAACYFSRRYRVVCPDSLGRGLSAWSSDPDSDYTLQSYAAQAVAMLDHLGIGVCQWVGTSMGGLLGMTLASGPLRSRISRLVLNDIGARLNPAAITRIRAYVSARPSFASVTEAESYFRQVYAGFGDLSDGEWRVMAETSIRRRDDGRLTTHFDPEVMRVFAEMPNCQNYWPEWDGISCPTMVLRGANSDVLLPEVAEEMTRRGPGGRLEIIRGCGHAPFLNQPDQLDLVQSFLTELIPL